MILNSKIYGQEIQEIPLLVFHGLFGISDNWGTFGREFGQWMPCHLVDLRNHGKSFHSDEMSHQIMAEDILNYINHYQLDKVNLLGHSLGGKAVMQFAISYPERVNKLVVADIAPRAYRPHHQTAFEALQSVDFSAVSARKDVEIQLEKYITDRAMLLFLLKNLYWEQENKLSWRFNLKTLSEKYADLIGNIEGKGVFGGKTLFLAGEKSNYILPEDEILICEKFPDSQIVKIKNAGHWLQVDNSQDFNNSVKDFLIKG